MCPGVLLPHAQPIREKVQMAGLHQRDQATANSGIVVELKLEDFSRLQNTVLWLEWNSKV
jgi:hypothetical protein